MLLYRLRAFLGSRVNAWIGVLLIVALVLAALIGMIGTPHDPLVPDFRARLAAPGEGYLLGTDQFGRDVLSRMLIGARESLAIAALSAGLAVFLGVLIGATSSFFGGWPDRIVSACLDALMAFPGLLLAMAIIAVIGPGKYGVIFALSLAYTPAVVRVVRSAVLSIREREYVDASRALGNGDLVTIVRHVIPNCVGPLTVMGSSLFASALLSESALSFLGIGVPPPYPTWGGMLADARQFAGSAPWLVVAPGVAISATLLGANMLGDALRDFFDPRMER
ncbi:ABC transporter permease [Aureimonas populi]|uniref:ABC transporter permease n=1 Tax=Aureimonas populi TaxID=1701758 RepID=A0ABW5CLM7_9HYPH|nr:ABC transporter permease [Aureimonas populi]